MKKRFKLPHRRGEYNGHHKLTWKQIEKIRSLWPDNTQTKIAKIFHVSLPCINRIISGQSWMAFVLLTIYPGCVSLGYHQKKLNELRGIEDFSSKRFVSQEEKEYNDFMNKTGDYYDREVR